MWMSKWWNVLFLTGDWFYKHCKVQLIFVLLPVEVEFTWPHTRNAGWHLNGQFSVDIYTGTAVCTQVMRHLSWLVSTFKSWIYIMSYHPCIKIHPNTNLSGCPDPDAEEAADNIRVSIVRGVHLVELQTKVHEDFTIQSRRRPLLATGWFSCSHY